MPPLATIRATTIALTALLFIQPSRADEPAILADIKAFFQTADLDRREELARRIESDAVYDRVKLRDWLHQADLFELLQPGQTDISVPIESNKTIRVTLRIPAGYDPQRAYPLIYALHGTHGSGPGIIRYVESVFGSKIDEYIVAAPSSYGHFYIGTEDPPSAQHLDALVQIKKRAHIDSDRVFVMGYSMGGHGSWTLAFMHADQFAGALPLAGSFIVSFIEKLWPPFTPNIQHTHILCCWGENDIYLDDGSTLSPNGGIAETNRLMQALAEKEKLPLVMHEFSDKGHGGISPPPELLDALLAQRRARYPKKIEHTFRHTYQARAYWLEGHAWKGPHWTDNNFGTINLRPGEKPDDALMREMRTRLGQLRGKVTGAEVDGAEFSRAFHPRILLPSALRAAGTHTCRHLQHFAQRRSR